ncbi:putative type VI secretion system effector [Burkholderia territorii]|uniref:putative type VI secretion system effector n=1 Tax=Burkholderia territorii TaxID=1503055 RepID=UPI0009BF52D4|nr:putative type VI secretion system effector [Burkholderia territorii]
MNAIATDISPTHLLHGRIQNMRKTRLNQDFFFKSGDRAKMEATAIAAGLVGLGGVATGLGGTLMDTTEEADLLEFDLDGKAVRAWVWQSVFNEGDEVEVVADNMGDSWQGYGIRRTSDKIVALHPYCSRGRNAHYKSSFKWWMKIYATLLLSTYLLITIVGLFESAPPIVAVIATCAAGGVLAAIITGIIAFRIAKKFMGFVFLAEAIFEGFGWSDVRNIDLPAYTKRRKEPGEPAALGVLYFRYSAD